MLVSSLRPVPKTGTRNLAIFHAFDLQPGHLVVLFLIGECELGLYRNNNLLHS